MAALLWHSASDRAPEIWRIFAGSHARPPDFQRLGSPVALEREGKEIQSPAEWQSTLDFSILVDNLAEFSEHLLGKVAVWIAG
jgi:hypothetical protein